MKSKRDALKEFSRAFNRYWRSEWIDSHRRDLINKDYDILLETLQDKWARLITLGVDLTRINAELSLDFMPYECDNSEEAWVGEAIERQYQYFKKFPKRKDFLFLRTKQRK